MDLAVIRQMYAAVLSGDVTAARELLRARPEHPGSLETSVGWAVHFLDVIPLYEEERDLQLERGTAALLELFARFGVAREVTPRRANVVLEARRAGRG